MLPDARTLLAQRDHRPFPFPRGPWVMRQTWLDLLFAHWPIPVEQLRRRVPRALELDTFEGQAWIGVVPFRMRGVTPRFVPPLPGLSAFPELNVRTYVRVGDRPGVYFFSLDAANWVAVQAARATFFLPYFLARMGLEEREGWIHYRSHRIHRGAPSADLVGRYRPVGPVSNAAPGTLDRWLTERYALYSVDQRGRAYRGDVHHLAWPLQPAEAHFDRNTLLQPHGLTLPDVPPLLHFSRRLDVLVWPPSLAAPTAPASACC